MRLSFTAEAFHASDPLSQRDGYFELHRVGSCTLTPPAHVEGVDLLIDDDTSSTQIALTITLGVGAGTASMGMVLLSLDLDDAVQVAFISHEES
jgi:hypothetical protein